jgi:hypothetical protein
MAAGRLIGFLGDSDDPDDDENNVILVSEENPLPCVVIEPE